MLALVLKTFPYSPDGSTVVSLNPSDEAVEIRDDLIDGLEREGYLRRVGDGPTQVVTVVATPKVAGAVANGQAEIPADWETLGWFKLKALVAKVTGIDPANKPDALTAMKDEVARRAAAAAN